MSKQYEHTVLPELLIQQRSANLNLTIGDNKKDSQFIRLRPSTIYRELKRNKDNRVILSKKGCKLYLNLRHRAKKRQSRRYCYQRHVLIANAVSIELRPKIVDTRKRLGDFEVDTIIGAHQEAIAKALDCCYYFAHTYLSWERGTNENTNGLIRQYFPKKMAFDSITDEEVQAVAYRLNHRPRKRLNFKTPYKVFY